MMSSANFSRPFVKLWLATAVAIFVWFAAQAELLDVAAMLCALVVAVIAMILTLMDRRRYLAALTTCAAATLAAAMFYCWMEAKEKADQFAMNFIHAHSCAPQFDELLVDSGEWKRVRGSAVMLEANVAFFGASRNVTYQHNGLLRYGYMDDTRAVWIPQCGLKLGKGTGLKK